MNRQRVVSSNIISIGYDSEESILEVEFQGGSVYQYFEVPEAVWRQFAVAPSKGKYLAREIKARGYRYERIQ